MVCCGMYGMVGFGCDMRCDGADGLAGLSFDALFGACAGWVLVIMARLVRRCGMALGAATAAAVRIVRWLGFWRTRRLSYSAELELTSRTRRA